MIYDITQVTTYDYVGTVPFAQHILRMIPVDRIGQSVLSAHVHIEPKPVGAAEAVDFFGNRSIAVEIAALHRRLLVRSTARVAVMPPPLPPPDATPAWEDVRDAALDSTDLAALSPVHFLFASRLVPFTEAIEAYARTSFPPGRPILAAAADLMLRINGDFRYSPGSTDVRTPPAEAFRLRRGVCQDFAHVMIAGMRGLGLPAAYVSGYLRTYPPPGRERLAGADATHAWAAVWCGQAAGWIGLDPTNKIPAGEDHIVLAVGRDYADVAPLNGIIISSGDQRLHVGVDVVPVEASGELAVRPSLTAERGRLPA